MEKKRKTNIELIIDILRSGKTLTLSEITALISEISGKKVKMTDISSQLSKLSSKDKKEIGYLISREKTRDNSFAYSLVGEALDMDPREMYDLTRKTGKNRFTLDDAVEKYPALGKYIDRPTGRSRPAKPRELPPEEPEIELPAEDLDIIRMIRKIVETGIKIDLNVTIRFSGPEN